jgi:hypothetical protein
MDGLRVAVGREKGAMEGWFASIDFIAINFIAMQANR